MSDEMIAKVRGYLRKHPSAETAEVSEATGATGQRVGRVRRAMVESGEIAAEAEVVAPLALVATDGAPKSSAIRQRVAELEEDNLGYRQRVVELLEHIAELSMEQVRLQRIARATQED